LDWVKKRGSKKTKNANKKGSRWQAVTVLGWIGPPDCLFAFRALRPEKMG